MSIVTDTEKLSAAELAPHIETAWQAQRAHVAASPLYRALWQGQTVPRDLRDLPELPLSDKSQPRQSQADHPPLGDYLATPPALANRLHRTSGTTGQAMKRVLNQAALPDLHCALQLETDAAFAGFLDPETTRRLKAF